MDDQEEDMLVGGEAEEVSPQHRVPAKVKWPAHLAAKETLQFGPTASVRDGAQVDGRHRDGTARLDLLPGDPVDELNRRPQWLVPGDDRVKGIAERGDDEGTLESHR
jgi:hypothetical protein